MGRRSEARGHRGAHSHGRRQIRGMFRPLRAEDLDARVLTAVVSRSGIDPILIEDVVMGQSYANSEAPCIGRWAALEAGLPIRVAGLQTDRRCGTGLQALVTASMMVQTGAADVVLAGGVESMSNIEHYTTGARWGTRAGSLNLYDRLDRGRESSQPEWRFGKISGMIETAENVATRCGIGREESDAFAAESHAKAQPPRKRRKVIRRRDHRREGGNAAGTGRGRPRRRYSTGNHARDPGAPAPVKDGSSPRATRVSRTMRRRRARRRRGPTSTNSGLEPLGFLRGWAAAGCEPRRMGLGPVAAVQKLFRRTGASFDDSR